MPFGTTASRRTGVVWGAHFLLQSSRTPSLVLTSAEFASVCSSFCQPGCVVSSEESSTNLPPSPPSGGRLRGIPSIAAKTLDVNSESPAPNRTVQPTVIGKRRVIWAVAADIVLLK